MNAINHTEAQAIHPAASTAPAVLLEAADPSKNLILVPLSRLVSRPTGRNVRKTPRMSIPELAASIQRVGLLQNLIVTATADGERYESWPEAVALPPSSCWRKSTASARNGRCLACWWPMAPPAPPA